MTIERRVLLAGSASLALLPATPSLAAATVGQPAPAFEAIDSNDKKWSLAALKGKVVVLETTNHDCPYVRKHYGAGNMQNQQRQAAAKNPTSSDLSAIPHGPAPLLKWNHNTPAGGLAAWGWVAGRCYSRPGGRLPVYVPVYEPAYEPVYEAVEVER